MLTAWLTIFMALIQAGYGSSSLPERLKQKFNLEAVDSVHVRNISIYFGPSKEDFGGTVIFAHGNHIIDTTQYCPSCSDPINILDLDGDGIEEIVIVNYTYGAHCCLYYEFFKPTPNGVKFIGTIWTGNGNLDFKDLDGDSVPEIILWNDDFAYFNGSFVESPWYFNIIQLRNDSFADVSRKFHTAIEQDIQKVVEKIKTGNTYLPHHSLAVELYVRFKLIGRDRDGLDAVRIFLPDSYRWFLRKRAYIDSTVTASLSDRISYKK